MPEPELSSCSAVPAGLVPRFRDELAASGYRVTMDDRRLSDPALRVNSELWRRRDGPAQALLRAAAAEPLGQVVWTSWPMLGWYAAQFRALFPEARVLIAANPGFGAGEVWQEIERALREPVGLLSTGEYLGRDARFLVTTFSWLPRLPSGTWPVVLPALLNDSPISPAMYRAVVALRARRLYTLVFPSLRLGRTSALRLEALSGRVIHAPDYC